MRLAINGWFYNQLHTGSGQYLRQLLAQLPSAAPDIEPILVLPEKAPAEGVSGAACHASGVKCRVSGAPRSDLGKVWFEQYAFPRACRECAADLAHIPYWAPPLSSPAPFVVTVHDIMPVLLPEYRGSALVRLYNALVSAATPGAAHIIADSGSSRRDILDRLLVPAERVTVIPLAVGRHYRPAPPSAADAAIRHKYDLPETYVLYLGGFDPRKNVRSLLAGWTWADGPLGEQYPLVIAGSLPKRGDRFYDDLRGYAQQLDIAASVRFVGPIEEADKPAVYRGAACFVYPSRYEGFGLPPLEAMACGVPVVTTAFSSIPEVVGEAAYLVRDPQDTRSLGAAIITVIVEPAVSESLIEKGLAQAKKFNWERTARETVEVYKRALEVSRFP